MKRGRHSEQPPARPPLPTAAALARRPDSPAPIQLPNGYSVHFRPIQEGETVGHDAGDGGSSGSRQPARAEPSFAELMSPPSTRSPLATHSREQSWRPGSSSPSPDFTPSDDDHRWNEVGVADAPSFPAWPDLRDATSVERYHRQVRDHFDDLWQRSLEKSASPEALQAHAAARKRSAGVEASRRSYRQPGTRSVSYRERRTSHNYSHSRQL